MKRRRKDPVRQPRDAAPAADERPAGLLRRLGALTYDSLLVLALWLATLFPLVAVSNDAVYGATIQTLLFLELYAFFVFFWLFRGQTLGMLAWKLQIRADDGAPLSLVRVTLRLIGGILPLVVAAFAWRLLGLGVALVCLGIGAIGYLWILIDPFRRSWTDLLSGTRIIQTRISTARL